MNARYGVPALQLASWPPLFDPKGRRIAGRRRLAASLGTMGLALARASAWDAPAQSRWRPVMVHVWTCRFCPYSVVVSPGPGAVAMAADDHRELQHRGSRRERSSGR